MQVTPLFHVGAVLLVLSNIAAGSQLLLLPEFLPGPAAEALAERQVSKTLLVPAMIRWLLNDPGLAGRSFPDLQMIAYGAAPIPPQLLLEAFDVFDCGFVQGYGLTETAGVITSLRPEDHHGDPGRLASAGRAVLCSRVRIVDGDDQPLPPGEVGEIVAQGDNITPGYWGLEDATAEALRGGWFHTGDVGWMDDEGFVTIVDRLKDMVLVGGENVYPSEAERALESHPDVVEAGVIGIPHDVWGEQLLAFVVLHPGATATDRELIAHCRTDLARFKCPTRVELREALPRNAAGKLLKTELREPYWSDRSRRV
jgi:acyl-CoA synthetase (AMP-forming)/AMP-acid ligase II